MPERAEIEAATDALLEDSGLPRYGAHRNTVERRVRIAFEAADRVRDARGDDEVRGQMWGDPPAARSPQGEDHEAARQAITDATRALNAELPGEARLALKAAMRHLEADETDDA